MVEKRHTSTAAFTREAVRLVTVQGYGVAEAARHVGLNAMRLGRWKRAQEAQEARAVPGKGRVSPAPAALHRLREAQTRLRLERARFKQAAAFFAHELTCGRPGWLSTRRGGRYPPCVRCCRSAAAAFLPRCSAKLPPMEGRKRRPSGLG